MFIQIQMNKSCAIEIARKILCHFFVDRNSNFSAAAMKWIVLLKALLSKTSCLQWLQADQYITVQDLQEGDDSTCCILAVSLSGVERGLFDANQLHVHVCNVRLIYALSLHSFYIDYVMLPYLLNTNAIVLQLSWRTCLVSSDSVKFYWKINILN